LNKIDVMNSEDDSLVSAYLDGQLDPGEKQRVEAALISDPRLAEELRSLTDLRDLMASLPRDNSVDVSTHVMERILPRRRRRFGYALPWPAVPTRVVGVLGAAGLAAGLLLAISLSSLLYSRVPGRAVPGRGLTGSLVLGPRASSSSDSATHPAAAGARVTAYSLAELDRSQDQAATLELASTFDLGDSIADAGASGRHDLEHFRQLLANPSQRRFILLSDGPDSDAEQRVASVIEQSTRFGFYKLTIEHGIVIDPRHPEQATVFAVLVDADELVTLRDRIKAIVPDRIEEPTVDPALTNRLADIGQVQARRPAPLGEVLIPREQLALRTPRADHNEELPAGAEAEPRDRPTIEQERSAPVPAPLVAASGSEVVPGRDRALGSEGARSPSGRHAAQTSPGTGATRARQSTRGIGLAPAKIDDGIVVLVWVTKAGPR
jgi:hypothetical protein